MKISLENLPAFENYLFIERKIKLNHSYRSRYKILSQYFSNNDFTRENFNNFLMEMKKKGYKNSYLNTFIRIMKHLVRFYKLEGFEDYTRFKTEQGQYKDYLTVEEVKKLAEVQIEGRGRAEINARYRIVIYTLFLTGMRINELLTLTPKDIHFDKIIIRPEVNKTSWGRIIPIKPFLYNMLSPYLTKNNEVIFDLAPQTTNREFKRRAEILGIKKEIHNHTFRYSLITHLAQERVPLSYISKLVGHASTETTAKIYVHAVYDDILEAVEANLLYIHEDPVEKTMDRVRSYLTKIANPEKFVLNLNKLPLVLRPLISEANHLDS